MISVIRRAMSGAVITAVNMENPTLSESKVSLSHHSTMNPETTPNGGSRILCSHIDDKWQKIGNLNIFGEHLFEPRRKKRDRNPEEKPADKRRKPQSHEGANGFGIVIGIQIGRAHV